MGDSVQIVIVTFQSERHIGACLEAALATKGRSDRVVIVDNGSSDATRAIVESFSGRPDVSIVLNATNRLYTPACNQAIQLGSEEHILLLNPDTVLPSNWRGSMLALATRPNVAAVGPLSDYVAGRQNIAIHLPPEAGIIQLTQVPKVLFEWNGGTFESTKMLIGFCMLLSREVLASVGLLDERTALGSDDLELSWRLRQAGYDLMIARDVFVRHVGQASFASMDPVTRGSLVSQSDAALHQKLLEFYGPGRIPSSAELFGSSIFEPVLNALGR